MNFLFYHDLLIYTYNAIKKVEEQEQQKNLM